LDVYLEGQKWSLLQKDTYPKKLAARYVTSITIIDTIIDTIILHIHTYTHIYTLTTPINLLGRSTWCHAMEA
jgi:hypothetical protein